MYHQIEAYGFDDDLIEQMMKDIEAAPSVDAPSIPPKFQREITSSKGSIDDALLEIDLTGIRDPDEIIDQFGEEVYLAYLERG